MVKCVISDLGKVIIFFDNHIFFKKIEKYCPFSAEEVAEQVFQHIAFIRSFDTGHITPEDFFSGVIQRLHAKIDYETFYSIYNDVFSLNLPVLEILKSLKWRYKLVLLSNTDMMRFGFVKKRFPEILIFDEYVVSFEVGYMKPHPLIYRYALDKAEAEPQECVFIDDREENIAAAEKMGMSGILFKSCTDLRAELKEKGLILDAKPSDST